MVQVEAKTGINPEDPSAFMMPEVTYKIRPKVTPKNIIKIDLLLRVWVMPKKQAIKVIATKSIGLLKRELK